MKKVLNMLISAVLCIALLPISALAAPTTLSHVDLTIELPKGGDLFDPSYTPSVTSFTSGGVNLLENGAGFLSVRWDGDCDLDGNGVPYFRGGGTYLVSLQLSFGSGYCTVGTTASTGETVATPETFSATVNGKAATVHRNCSTYYPTVDVTLKLEGEALSAAEKAEKNAEWAQLTKTRRAMLTPRTRDEAETYNRDNTPENVVVVTDPEGKDLMSALEGMTTLVLNVNNANTMTDYIANSSYLKEIWLSPDSDPYTFISAMSKSQYSAVGGAYRYESSAAIPLYLADATVFIPESRVSEFLQSSKAMGYAGAAFSIKSYSGSDVLAAQSKGASAAKELCTSHSYTEQIRSADRVYHFADHDNLDLYYYSCAFCGKCEYNPNHVAYSTKLQNDAAFDSLLLNLKCTQRHSTNAELPADSVYIGVNAAGEHVWWQSCELCGVFSRYAINSYDHKASGNAATFADYNAAWTAALKLQEAQALGSTERYPGTFTLPLKSDAKMSTWAQSDVNLALNDDLLDTALLGGDYTKNITRLQFCSVAVKLAETLIGKEIPPAPSDTFSDTDNLYVRKAYSAGITGGVTATTFDPAGTLNRQQMATFIYRALRYAEKNSDCRYTDYTSKLSSYTDSWAIQSWANEAMAFMNALDLIKGTSATALNPDGLCTIEQAVAVAERSVYAHLIGIYQVKPATAYSATSTLGNAKMSGYALREGDYVWVTGRRYGTYNVFSKESDNLPHVYVPIQNPFNGQSSEMKNGDLVPVRN